jgi:F-type H+-transporting ATPase subunit gamma
MRRRIRAVKSTQQITKAMKMVAASKLRRAQERVVSSRPFAQEAQRLLASISSRVDPSTHPLLARRPGLEKGPALVLAFTSDRGLCGSFNSHVIKTAMSFVRQNPGRELSFGLIGRKGRDVLKRRGLAVRFDYVNLPKTLELVDAETIAEPAIDDFKSGRVDSVHLVYNEFKSVMAQQVVVERLLPMEPLTLDEREKAGENGEYLFEPSAERILDVLLERLVQVRILSALFEGVAAEHAARMTAMDAATNNSADIIEGLTLTMNKVRQAAITREIIEVVSGAQS